MGNGTLRKLAITGVVFDEKWKGGEPRLAKEVFTYLSRKYECKVPPSLNLRSIRMMGRLFLEKGFPLSRYVYKNFFENFQPDVLLAFYDFDFASLSAAQESSIPIVLTQHIYWGLCPKNDFWNNNFLKMCYNIPKNLRDCRKCISNSGNLTSKLINFSPGKLIKINLEKQKYFLEIADKIIVPSNYMREIYRTEININENKIVVIHNGVRTRLFKPTLGQKKKWVLFVGGRSILKGFPFFLSLAKLIKAKHPDITFLASGFGPEIKDKNVQYLGYISDLELAKIMAQATVLVFPAIWDDPFPQVPLEAMASGTPVVAFAVGGLKEMIIDGETGFLVSPGDIYHLAEKVELLLKDPLLLDSMSRKARQHVIENYSLSQMLRQYEMVLEDVVS
jgi:glycosyltransferase involved in cell wall biosynthesis